MVKSGQSDGIRIVAGLGNPGREYSGTRHNVGFEAIELAAEQSRAEWQAKAGWKALVARTSDGVILIKPMTFMNRSGEAVASVAHFYKVRPESILVVYDDVSLPLGRLRVRASGSHGGHNGMRSVLSMMQSENVPRVRIGIGDTQTADLVHHVLGKFSANEIACVRECITRAAAAIDLICKKGIDIAMNIYNKKEQTL